MSLQGFDEMAPFDHATLERVLAALDAREAFRYARMRLVYAVRMMGTRRPIPPIGPLDVLCRPRPDTMLHTFQRVAPYPAPRGWVWVREWDRACARLMPWWLAAPVMAWHYRWWAIAPLVRIGLLHVAEGDYWHNARPRGWARLVAFVKREWPGGWDAWRESHR